MDADRCREKTTSRKGKTIDLWHSGKTHDFGGNIQALFYPSGIPLWVSDVLPGNVHDLAAARENVLGCAAAVPGGYAGAGRSRIRRRRSRRSRPGAKPAGVKELDIGTRARNALIRSVRCLGERGFALLTQRWKTLQMSPPARAGSASSPAPRSCWCYSSTSPGCLGGRRDGVKIPGAAGLRLAGVAGAAWPGLAGLCGVSALAGGRRWRMRWCGRPLTSNHHGGPDPGHKPDAGSCLEGCELALRARGPDFRLPSAPAGGRDRLPHPHDRRP